MKILKWFKKLLKDTWPILIPFLIYLIIIIILWILQPDWIPDEFWEARNTTDFDPLWRYGIKSNI